MFPILLETESGLGLSGIAMNSDENIFNEYVEAAKALSGVDEANYPTALKRFNDARRAANEIRGINTKKKARK